jgi:predicted transcriptional regulator
MTQKKPQEITQRIREFSQQAKDGATPPKRFPPELKAAYDNLAAAYSRQKTAEEFLADASIEGEIEKIQSHQSAASAARLATEAAGQLFFNAYRMDLDRQESDESKMRYLMASLAGVTTATQQAADNTKKAGELKERATFLEERAEGLIRGAKANWAYTLRNEQVSHEQAIEMLKAAGKDVSPLEGFTA